MNSWVWARRVQLTSRRNSSPLAVARIRVRSSMDLKNSSAEKGWTSKVSLPASSLERERTWLMRPRRIRSTGRSLSAWMASPALRTAAMVSNPSTRFT